MEPGMKTIIKIVLAVLAAIFALAWLSEGNDFFLYKFFAPKREAVAREVFEQTKSYNQGMTQELQNMQFQYEQADKGHQEALRGIILHRAADFPEDKMPPSLRSFIQSLRNQQSRSF